MNNEPTQPLWEVGEDLTGDDLPDHDKDIFTQIRIRGYGTVALVDATPTDDPEVNSRAQRIVLAVNCHDDLLTACKAIMALIDTGYLVRDTTHDDDSDWAMKQLDPVQDMQSAQTAIAKAEGN